MNSSHANILITGATGNIGNFAKTKLGMPLPVIEGEKGMYGIPVGDLVKSAPTSR